MDERGISRSAPEDKSDSDRRPRLGGSVLKGAKSVVGATAAVAVVVGFYFGFPLLLIHFTSGLSLSTSGILLFFVALLAVVAVPIGGTMLVLGAIDELFFRESNLSVRGWPWFLTIPSVTGLVLLSTAPHWKSLAPHGYSVVSQFGVPETSIASWAITFVAVIMVLAEFGSGAISDYSSGEFQVNTDVSTSKETKESHRVKTDRQEFRERGQAVFENLNLDLSYNWQAPPDLGFADVGGLDDVKSDIHRRVITPLRTENDAYERFRVTPPTGILLYGPPGTGKSYLARAIAGELGSPFVELSQADLTSMWINESPRMIRRLFEEAELIGSSVIFIDEIDGLVATRDASGHREDSKLISELLARLGEEGTNYLIIAATNRPDQLDAAILRPGRFDEQFEIGLPGTRDREEFFKVQLRQRNPSITDSEFRILGKLSEGLTAADIASVVERAALRAAERDAPHISFDDLSMSLAEAS